MKQVPHSFIGWFRLAAPYINKHRNSTFIVAIPGEAIAHANFVNIVHDLVMLQSLGIKLVIVQGARLQINQRLQSFNLDIHFEKGVRVSSPEHMPHIIDATQQTKMMLECALSAGLLTDTESQASLRTLSGNFLSAKPLGIHNGVNYQQTGLVRKVDSQAINNALNQDSAVILTTLGYSPTGEVFNFSLTDIVIQLGKKLNADKIIAFMSNDVVEPLVATSIVKPKDIATLDVASDSEGVFLSSLAQLVESKKVERAHVVSYEQDGALLRELFTYDGSGLLITKQNLYQLREAQLKDAASLLELIQPLQETGALVQRTQEMLENCIADFVVVEVDGTTVACAALHQLSDDMYEVACLAVNPEFQGRQFAKELMNFILVKARVLNVKKLFALTTQAEHWFIRQGFVKTTTNALPACKNDTYSTERNSTVLLKHIK